MGGEVGGQGGAPERCGRTGAARRGRRRGVLARLAACPLVRGIRDKPQAAPSPDAVVRSAAGSMGDPRWHAGYARLGRHGLSFDLQTPWWHLREAAALARAFPDTLMILNHTGLPADRSPEGLRGWRDAMATLAAEPNVAVKISGLGVPGRLWTTESNRDVVLRAIDLFGSTARCSRRTSRSTASSRASTRSTRDSRRSCATFRWLTGAVSSTTTPCGSTDSSSRVRRRSRTRLTPALGCNTQEINAARKRVSARRRRRGRLPMPALDERPARQTIILPSACSMTSSAHGAPGVRVAEIMLG